MPIYEYSCATCDEEFERIVRVSAPNPACPSCGSEETDKKISLSAFHLKGGGWYSDGYTGRGKSGPDAAGSDGGKPSDSGKASASDSGKASSSDSGKASASDSARSGSSDSGKASGSKSSAA